ncbi:MAG: hypothetical protein AAB768_01340 [Patescibacteria group bacterium]
MTKSIVTENIQEITQRLVDCNYAIRGTASLVLQGLDFVVADIDVLCDEETAKYLNLTYSESKQFKGYLGKLSEKAEIYGNWQIKNNNGEWSEILVPTSMNSKLLTINNIDIPVTTIEFELHCYALMGRWNVFHKIKRLIDFSS